MKLFSKNVTQTFKPVPRLQHRLEGLCHFGRSWLRQIALMLLIQISLNSGLALTPPVTTIEITSQTGNYIEYRVSDPIAGGYHTNSDGAAFP